MDVPVMQAPADGGSGRLSFGALTSDTGLSPVNTGGGDATAPAARGAGAAAPPVAEQRQQPARGPSSAAAAGNAAPPAPAAALPSLTAALDHAERLLAPLRSEGERAGHKLRGVPEAQLLAVIAACDSLIAHANRDDGRARLLVVGRGGLWSAAVQVHAMALRDMERDPPPTLQRLTFSLCSLLGVTASACEAVVHAKVQGKAVYAAAIFGVDLSLALVRGDALQAHARILARAHQRLRSSSVEAQQEEAAQGRGAAMPAAMASASDALCVAMINIQTAARPLLWTAGSSHAELRCRQLQEALIRALHASNVLEHVARLRMELQRAEHQLRERAAAEGDGGLASHQDGTDEDDDGYRPAGAVQLDAIWGVLMQVLAGVQPPCRTSRIQLGHAGALALLNHRPYSSLMGGGGAHGVDGAPLLLQLRSLARQPCLQLYAGWRLAAHLCHEAGAQLFGMPDSLLPVEQLGEEERLQHFSAAALLWSWALWAPPDHSGEGAAASAQGSTLQPLLPPLPYKPVHMVRLLCGALPAGEEMADLHSMAAAVCYHALLYHPVPLAEAEAMLRGVWQAILPSVFQDGAGTSTIAGRLLRLAPSAGADGGTTAAVADPVLPLSMRCALEAGLLRGLEGSLRGAGRALARADVLGGGGGDTFDIAMEVMCKMDLLLRRPGTWPALLSHAPQRQVAALVVTMCKMLRVVKKRAPSFEITCRFQLAALLEQAVAVMWAARTGSAYRDAAWGRSLQLSGLGVDEYDLCDGEAARAAPSLDLLARLGGSPAPGSPAAQQQRTLAVFAAAQWLPELLIADREDDLRGYSHEHDITRSLMAWLRLVTDNCLQARWAAAEEQERSGGSPAPGSGAGASGSPAPELRPPARAAHASWRQLVCAELRMAPLLLKWLSTAARNATRIEAQAGDHLCDLLELLVVAAPEHVAEALQPGKPFAELVPSGPVAILAKRLLQRYGRSGLWSTLCKLGKSRGLPPGWQPPEQLLADAPHLRPGAGPDWAPLPPPCEAAGVLPLCSYPFCMGFDGESEVDVTLRACGRCGAARYCSPACQRAHWAAGHKAECAGGSARG